MATREAMCSCGRLRAEVDGDPVRITGESRKFVRISDDGEERRFHFCPGCGATVYYATDPEFVAIPVGVLADPGFPEPTVSVWESRRHPWVGLPADAERHA